MFPQATEAASSQESLLFPMLKLKMPNPEVKKYQNNVTEVWKQSKRESFRLLWVSGWRFSLKKRDVSAFQLDDVFINMY